LERVNNWRRCVTLENITCLKLGAKVCSNLGNDDDDDDDDNSSIEQSSF
jgi:hypothetical protein